MFTAGRGHLECSIVESLTFAQVNVCCFLRLYCTTSCVNGTREFTQIETGEGGKRGPW